MQSTDDIFTCFSGSGFASAMGVMLAGAVCSLLSLTAFYSAPKIVGAEFLPQDSDSRA